MATKAKKPDGPWPVRLCSLRLRAADYLAATAAFSAGFWKVETTLLL